MAQFPKNPQRLTPYSNFRFKIMWDNQFVAGVSRVGLLTRSTEVMRHRDGGDPSMVHLAPGQTAYGPIVLERGVSYDPAFAQWANKVFDFTNSQGAVGQNTSLGDFRKQLSIQIFNEAGIKVVAFNVYNAWVSEYSGSSELDGSGNGFVLETMTVQNEGWERDTSVTEVAETSFTLPAS